MAIVIAEKRNTDKKSDAIQTYNNNDNNRVSIPVGACVYLIYRSYTVITLQQQLGLPVMYTVGYNISTPAFGIQGVTAEDLTK